MLDGLKMEENFQSAIETSASFSSLLGKWSGRAPQAHPPSSRPQFCSPAHRDPFGSKGATALGLSPRSVCPSVPVGPSYPEPTSRPRSHAPGTEFPKAARGGRDCSRGLSGK